MTVRIMDHPNPKANEVFDLILYGDDSVGVCQLYQGQVYIMMQVRAWGRERDEIIEAVLEHFDGAPLAKFCNQPIPPDEEQSESNIITDMFE